MLSERTLIKTKSWMFNTMKHWNERFTNLGRFLRGLFFQCLTWAFHFFSLKRQALNTCNDIARLYFKTGHNCRFHPLSNQDPRATRLGCLTSHRRNGLFWYSIMLSWACTVWSSWRAQLSVHPGPHRQKVRAPISSCRCFGAPLHPSIQYLQNKKPRWLWKITSALAPKFACFLSEARFWSCNFTQILLSAQFL